MTTMEAYEVLENAKKFHFIGHDKVCEAIDMALKSLYLRSNIEDGMGKLKEEFDDKTYKLICYDLDWSDN